MIVGVKIFSLNQIHDERKIMNMLRNDDPHFTKFGEIYFSEILSQWKVVGIIIKK